MKILHIVHCVDTEGPLNETINATFERLKNVFGFNIYQSKKNLSKLQNKEINTHLQVVLYLDSARAEIVFRVVELLYAIQVSIAGQMDRLVGW